MATCNQFMAPNGEPSLLYAGLLQKYGEDRATQIWNWVNSPAFNKADELDINGEPSLSAVENQMQSPEVQAQTKLVAALQLPKVAQLFDKFFTKNPGKFYQELIPLAGKQQVQWLKDYVQSDSPTTFGDLVAGITAQMSYTVEINTAKETYVEEGWVSKTFSHNDNFYEYDDFDNKYKKYVNGATQILTKEEYVKNFEEHRKSTLKLTQHYSNLTVPGGTNYTENEIATPAITPSIKGHAQFATSNGIGWFRSDESQQYQETDIQSIIDNLQKSGQLEINCK